ncbi:site-specific integrase [Sphingomonas sp. SUN019]|uniref:site-specific integrase n=1 Tax=Sphingomonas sp. SUN019 TaxID=2937788 RepID=UPI0021640FEE|nr:site-specific integrase [Sphingomonas sp. SUN019]UVO49160.1 site-specific integrase [Sphingomonas sp. SUN019]
MDDDMAKYPGLKADSRSGIYKLRKRIPADLQHIDTRGSVRISLETKDKREAVRAYPRKLAEIEEGFARLRREVRSKGFLETALATARIDDLGHPQIERLITEWWQGRKRVREPSGEQGMDRRELLASLQGDERLWALAQTEGRDLAGEVADRLLVDAGAAAKPMRVGKIKTHVQHSKIDHSTASFRLLRDLVQRGFEIEDILARDFVSGKNTAPPHPIFNRSGQANAANVRTVEDLVSAFRTERERKHGVESTARKYGLLFRIVREVWGADRALGEVDRPRCYDLIEFIGQLPANGAQKFPGLTLTQSVGVAETGNHKRLAPNTVSSYVQNLCAMLRWGKRHGYGVAVDTDGLTPSGRAQVQRRGLQRPELDRLFVALSQFKSKEPHKYWVPALALYTGARAEELCQLRTEDVTEVDGIACLNLTRFDPTGRAVAEKRFKNDWSERWVPLHAELLAAGFITFVEASDPAGRLFPALKAGTKGNFSHNFSKWFGRFMSSVGLDDPALVFHSFRHGFRDACRNADIPDETAHALGGWATTNQGQRYGNRGAVPNLDRAMKRIGYTGFSLVRLESQMPNTNPKGA